jgi:hypothetical protein
MPNSGSIYDEQQYILQRGDEKLFQPSPSSFAKEMAYYLYDCNELAGKILNREYRMADMYEIVDHYNSWKAMKDSKSKK